MRRVLRRVNAALLLVAALAAGVLAVATPP